MIDAYAVANRPGYKFSSRMPRNETNSTYEHSVEKFVKSRNDRNESSSVQGQPIFATNNLIDLDQNITGRFPGTFASQLNNRKRKQTLGIDMSAANLVSYA